MPKIRHLLYIVSIYTARIRVFMYSIHVGDSNEINYALSSTDGILLPRQLTNFLSFAISMQKSVAFICIGGKAIIIMCRHRKQMH